MKKYKILWQPSSSSVGCRPVVSLTCYALLFFRAISAELLAVTVITNTKYNTHQAQGQLLKCFGTAHINSPCTTCNKLCRPENSEVSIMSFQGRVFKTQPTNNQIIHKITHKQNDKHNMSVRKTRYTIQHRQCWIVTRYFLE